MDFELSEEQKMLQTMARDFLTAECPKKLVKEMIDDEKGYPPQLWRKMSDLGWIQLAFPEEYGGTGGSFLDLAVLLEEMGRALLPGPFFSTVVLGGMTILALGNETQKKELLPKIGRGESIVTLAVTEPNGRYDLDGIETKAVADGDNYIINGTKLFVTDAHIADYIICAAKTNRGITLFLVEGKSTGVRCDLLKTIGGDRQCEVKFNNVKVKRENIIGKLGQGRDGLNDALNKAAVAKCAEMVGGAQQVLDMTVDYAKTRVQFDRPIGSFQIIQHYLVDMLTNVETARFLTYEAAHNIARGLPYTKEAAVAKAWVGEAYRRTAAVAHQVHGAIGYSRDYDLYLYFKKAKGDGLLLGDPAYHRETVAREIGL